MKTDPYDYEVRYHHCAPHAYADYDCACSKNAYYRTLDETLSEAHAYAAEHREIHSATVLERSQVGQTIEACALRF